MGATTGGRGCAADEWEAVGIELKGEGVGARAKR